MSKSDDDLFIESLARCAAGNQGKNSVAGKSRVDEIATTGSGPLPRRPNTPRNGMSGLGVGRTTSSFPLRDIKVARQAQAVAVPTAQAAADTGYLKTEVEQIRSQLEGLLHRLEGVLSQL